MVKGHILAPKKALVNQSNSKPCVSLKFKGNKPTFEAVVSAEGHSLFFVPEIR